MKAISPETMNIIFSVVIAAHVVVDIIHYLLGFIDNRRTKKILDDVKTILEKQPPCIRELEKIKKLLEKLPEGE